MARQLVEVTNPTTGEREWVDRSTGEAKPFRSRQHGVPAVRAPVGEMLFEVEPHIHDKLLNGRALTWREISIAADVILRGVSQDSLRLMFGGGSMKELRMAIETMLAARKLCDKLSPLSTSSLLPGSGGNETRTTVQGAMATLLHLPGRS